MTTRGAEVRWECGKGFSVIVNLLLASGADIDATNSNGDTPIMNAVYYGKKELVQLLLSKGASVTTQNFYGVSPLARATKLGDNAVIKMLKDHGATA